MEEHRKKDYFAITKKDIWIVSIGFVLLLVGYLIGFFDSGFFILVGSVLLCYYVLRRVTEDKPYVWRWFFFRSFIILLLVIIIGPMLYPDSEAEHIARGTIYFIIADGAWTYSLIKKRREKE